MSKYTQTIETIDREKALAYLDKNGDNRPINDKTVDRYANQMTNGEWQVNGESLKFADTGELLDGQHRLSAVVKANVAVEMPIFRGIDKEAIKTMDTGKPRNLADHLAIHGFTGRRNVNLCTVAAATRIVNDFREDGSYVERRVKITPTEAIKFLQQNPELFDAAGLVADYRKTVHIPPSILVATYFLCAKIDKDKTTYLFDRLSSGVNLSEGSPVLALRNKLIQAEQVAGHDRGKRRMLISYILQAFKGLQKDRKMSVKDIVYRPSMEVTFAECEESSA